MASPTSNQPTLDFTPGKDITRDLSVTRAISIATDDDGEIRSLLRKQLRIAVTILLCIMPISIGSRVWVFLQAVTRGRDHWQEWLQVVTSVTLGGGLIVAAYFTFRTRFVSLAGFRRVEVVLFAVLSVLMAIGQFGEIIRGEIQRYTILGDPGVSFRMLGQAVG